MFGKQEFELASTKCNKNKKIGEIATTYIIRPYIMMFGKVATICFRMWIKKLCHSIY
jgi:hypothetical protein